MKKIILTLMSLTIASHVSAKTIECTASENVHGRPQGFATASIREFSSETWNPESFVYKNVNFTISGKGSAITVEAVGDISAISSSSSIVNRTIVNTTKVKSRYTDVVTLQCSFN